MTTSRTCARTRSPATAPRPRAFPLGPPAGRRRRAPVHRPAARSLGLLIVIAAFEGEAVTALWLGLATLFIDGTDGMLARRFRVKETIPWFDGARMDDIVDYLTYVFAPIVLLWTTDRLPDGPIGWVVAALPLLASCYQFCRVDAKTVRPLLPGLPELLERRRLLRDRAGRRPTGVAIALVVLTVLVFVPVRYVYPSRTRAAARPQRWRWPASGWSPTPCCSRSTPTRTPSSWRLASAYLVYYVGLSVYLTVGAPRPRLTSGRRAPAG